MLVLTGSYLLLIFVLPAVLSAVVSYRALPRTRCCPQCSGETLPLVDRWLKPLNTLSARTVMQRRWCLACGWEGVTRRPPDVRVAASPNRSRATTQTLDVRSLQVDGAAWRVMLQCWTSTGLFYGRLVFVGPNGRLWLDTVEAYSGSDQRDVLGQARSLPAPMLENRLRRLVSS